MNKLRVKDLMSTALITLEKEETVDLAGEIMKLARIRHLPVVEHGRLVGLVTHRDLLGAQVSMLSGLTQDESHAIERSIPVTSVMNSDVISVRPEATALEAAQMMREYKYGCLPVVEGDQLVGILTEADFLELVIRALQDQA